MVNSYFLSFENFILPSKLEELTERKKDRAIAYAAEVLTSFFFLLDGKRYDIAIIDYYFCGGKE